MKIASTGMPVIFRSNQKKQDNMDLPVVHEPKTSPSEAGKAVGYDSKEDTFTVEKWPKKETVGMQGYIDKKEKQLKVASQIITYQAMENDALKQENEKLKAQLGKNLNAVA